MVTPTNRACRPAGAGACRAALWLGLLALLTPSASRADAIQGDFSTRALLRRANHEARVRQYVDRQEALLRARASRLVAQPAAQVFSPATPRQVHEEAMAASRAGLVKSVVVSPGVRVTSVDGLLPQNPMIAYLKARRALNVVRFDRYHPTLGPMLALDDDLRSVPGSLDTRPGTAAPQVAIPPPSPPDKIVRFAAQTVPEPGTATIALVLIGSAALARRSRRRDA